MRALAFLQMKVLPKALIGHAPIHHIAEATALITGPDTVGAIHVVESSMSK